MKKVFLTGVAAIALLAISTNSYAESTFDFSGMIRLRPEMRENSDFNSSVDDKQAFVGSRTRLNVKATVTDDVTALVSIQDVRNWGDIGTINSGLEEQALDIYEAYFQINRIMDSPLSLKAGRQELKYGDQRLLGNLDWANQGRAHDALKLMLGFDGFKIDIFAAKEDESGHPSEDKYDDDLFGAYATVNISEGIGLDVYALNWKTARTDADGAAIKGHNIMTYGARLFGKLSGLDFTGEYAMQSGDWADGVSQEAYAFAVKAGYTVDFWKTRLGVEYDYGTGDDNASDDKNKNFVFPFHLNHAHYGFMDYFSWGNMSDIRISLKTQPAEKLTVSIDYHILSLAEGKGDWLNIVGTGVFKKAVAGKDSVDAGQEIDLTAIYKAMDNCKIVAGLSQFAPGDAAKERSGGKSDNSTWGYLMTVFTF